MTTREQIEAHLAAQYRAWADVIYPNKRARPDARLDIHLEDGTSCYDRRNDVIVIFIPEGNLSDFDHRIGAITTVPDRWSLCVSEIELLHEMMHERQYKESPEVSGVGRDLYAMFRTHFSGPGHDEVFYTAIAISSGYLHATPEQLVRNL